MTHLLRLILTASLAAFSFAGATITAHAQQKYKSPEDAVNALVALGPARFTLTMVDVGS